MMGLRNDHGRPVSRWLVALAAAAAVFAILVSFLSGWSPNTSAATVPGDVWTWGLDLRRFGERTPYGTRGTGPQLLTTPDEVVKLDKVIAIAAGFDHALALKADGTVWGWGNDDFGQIGNGTSGNRVSPVPEKAQYLSGVTAIAAGHGNSLALKSDGTLWIWGSESPGDPRYMPSVGKAIPVPLTGLDSVTKIAASVGGSQSLALKSDGTVWIWGGEPRSLVQVAGLGGVTDVAAGLSHKLALRSDGTVWAWGYNTFGQLGNLATADSESTVPVQVKDLTRVTAVAAGTWHSLALTSEGRVWAWGANGSGQLGNGLRQDMTIPVEVMGLTAVVAIAGGGGRLGEERGLGDRVSGHSLALKADGTVWAWGGGSMGEIGNGASGDGTYSAVPVQVSGLSGVSAISAGRSFNLALVPIIPPTLSPSPAPMLPQSSSPSASPLPAPTPAPSPSPWPSGTEQYLFIIVIVMLIAAFIIIYTRVRR